MNSETNNLNIDAAMFVPFENHQIITDPEEQQHYIDIADNLVEEYPNEWGAKWASKCGIWNSHGVKENILLQDDRFEELTQKIIQYTKQYAEAINLDIEEHGLELHESWVNANEPGHVQECHIHDWSFISGVYYIFDLLLRLKTQESRALGY